MRLSEVLESRHSVRAFLPTEVPDETLLRVLRLAQRAPSWCNIQPWRVWLLSGDARVRFTRAMEEAATARLPCPDVAFPGDYPEPYASHRKACGKVLYEAMGVARDDGAARRAAWMRNFAAFDAPHVALVGIDRSFGLYGALDVGCWLEALMLAAHAEGLGTCAQAALATFPDVARQVAGIGDEVSILFGVALGYEDLAAAANRARTARRPVEDNVTFVR